MNSVLSRAARALTRAVERPLAEVHATGDRTLRATVVVGRLRHEVELLWVGRGWPADVRRALSRIPSPWPRELVIVGHRFSSGALELLRERSANWVDEAGAASVETESGLFVVRDSTEDVASRPGRLSWGASAVDAVELLLTTRPAGAFTAAELADRSGWSHAQMTKLLRQFSAQGWVEKVGGSRGVGSGWRVADFNGLLEAWGENLAAEPPRTVRAHRTLREPMQFLRDDLAQELSTRMHWAVSGWAGLELAAPFMTTTPVLHVYVAAEALDDGRLRDAMLACGLREVDAGARVEFRALSPLGLSLASQHDQVPVVSAPRLYADLRAIGGRGEDAADHVREVLLDV